MKASLAVVNELADPTNSTPCSTASDIAMMPSSEPLAAPGKATVLLEPMGAPYSESPKTGTHVQDEAATPSGGLASPSSILAEGFPAATKPCNQLQGVKVAISTCPAAPPNALPPKPIARATSRTVSVRQAAVMLGVTRPTIYSWEAKGRMPARVRFMRRNQWHLVDIQEMVDKAGGAGPEGVI